MTTSYYIYKQRISNTNSFNTIYIKEFKNKNIKIELEFSEFSKNGFLKRKTTTTKSTLQKLEEFLKNCDSYYESMGIFNEIQDFNKFKRFFNINLT